MTGGLSKNFHGVGIGPLSEILAVKITIFSHSLGIQFLTRYIETHLFKVPGPEPKVFNSFEKPCGTFTTSCTSEQQDQMPFNVNDKAS